MAGFDKQLYPDLGAVSKSRMGIKTPVWKVEENQASKANTEHSANAFAIYFGDEMIGIAEFRRGDAHDLRIKFSTSIKLVGLGEQGEPINVVRPAKSGCGSCGKK